MATYLDEPIYPNEFPEHEYEPPEEEAKRCWECDALMPASATKPFYCSAPCRQAAGIDVAGAAVDGGGAEAGETEAASSEGTEPPPTTTCRRCADLQEALETIRDLYCDGRADADCAGDPPRFIPNDWMQVQTLIEEALR